MMIISLQKRVLNRGVPHNTLGLPLYEISWVRPERRFINAPHFRTCI